MSQQFLRSARRVANSNIFTSSTLRTLAGPTTRSFHTTLPRMVVKPITSKSEWDSLIAEGKPVLVDFYATWCGPCKAISPMFQQHSENKTFEGVTFVKVDVDALPDVAAENGIRAMPTFVLFKDGAKVDELLGANPTGLKALVEKST